MSWVLDFADNFKASITYCSNKYNYFQKIKKKMITIAHSCNLIREMESIKTGEF